MPGNLYQRNGVWWLRVQVAGREHRRSLRTGSRSRAEKRRDKIVEELTDGLYGQQAHTWKEAVSFWAERFCSGKAPGTVKRYQCSLRQVEPFLVGLEVHRITPAVIGRIAGRPGISNATRRRDLSAVSSVLRVCINEGWIATNPARLYDRGVIPERREPIRLPTDEEVAVVISEAHGRLADMIEFADLSGCRQEECAGLERTDLRGEAVTLRRTKTNRPRTILLNTPGGDADRVVTRVGTISALGGGYLFWHGGGQRYANVASRFRALIVRLVNAGKLAHPFRFHDLRHRFAVRWLGNGGDIYALSKHLGHRSVKVTEGYLAFVAPAQESAQRRRFGTHAGSQNDG